jgi:4-phytase/acid phosphatase
MTIRAALRLFLLSSACLLAGSIAFAAQSAEAGAAGQKAELQFVVVLSRHGVRSPIIKAGAIDQYSAAPWPQWDVPPSYLTAHGYELMKLFGAWDRVRLSEQGLFARTGCGDAGHVTIIADSDQRTRETGKALGEGMLPGCSIEFHAKPEGTVDPLFRIVGGLNQRERGLAAAAIAGRIGGDPNHLTEVYRPQLATLDQVLAGCGHAASPETKRVSIFDVPANFGDSSEYSSGYHGPLSVASTLAENLLLEYTNGMSDANVGWGCVDGATLRALMQLNAAHWEYSYRTPTVARIYASNLLDHIERSMEQSISGKPVAGALSKPDDRLLILVGHDTNIVTVSGALGINWIIDGRADDTPPGGALLFEIWRSRADGRPFVRLEYTAQTLEQMRQTQTLTPANPPALAPIFVPGCSGQDMSCTWDGFSAVLREVIDPAYVRAQP